MSVKVDRKRKVSATTFLRALGYASEDEITPIFQDVDTDATNQYIRSTLDRDPLIEDPEGAFKEEDLREVWAWLRPDDEYDRPKARQIASAQMEFYGGCGRANLPAWRTPAFLYATSSLSLAATTLVRWGATS